MSFYLGLNKASTYLPQVIELTGYEAAVIDCFLPVHIIAAGHHFKVYVSIDSGLSFDKCVEVRLPPFSQWANKILDVITTDLTDYLDVKLNEKGHIVIQTVASNLQAKLPYSLAKILGLSDCLVTNAAVEGTAVVTFDLLFQRIIVASNFVPSFQFHGTYLPCIYSGSPLKKEHFPFYIETSPGQYISLRLTFFNIFGDRLDIPDEHFHVLVHFRKKVLNESKHTTAMQNG